jgi:S1-C subfamily serine protease
VLSNDQGNWTVDPTPGEVQLMTSARALEVSCRARDQSAGTTLPPDALRPVSPAATAAGGAAGAGAAVAAFSPLLATAYAPLVGVFAIYSAVAGAGVGRAVDASARSYSYPSPVVVPFRCDPLSINSVGLAAAPLGVTVRGATAANELRSAAIVSALASGGRASQAGLIVGDAIVSAQGRPVDSPAALESSVHQVPASVPLTLGVLRGGQLLIIVMPPREQR